MDKPQDIDIDDSPLAQRLNAEHCRKLEQAARVPGFRGALRRAIDAALIPSHRLANECGVGVDQLEGFRAGENELPSDVVERLVSRLGLELTLEHSVQSS